LRARNWSEPAIARFRSTALREESRNHYADKIDPPSREATAWQASDQPSSRLPPTRSYGVTSLRARLPSSLKLRRDNTARQVSDEGREEWLMAEKKSALELLLPKNGSD